VGGARIFNIGGDEATQCSILSRLVGGAKGEACIEHFSRSVNGAAAVVIGGSWNTLAGLHSSTNVGGANTETVGGAKNIKSPKYALSALMLNESLASHSVNAGGDIKDVFKTTVTFDIGGSATLKGANVIVSGTSKITLKADGITVTLTDGDIKIDGKFDSSQKAEDKNDESYD
jgi:type VI secretion system secreted protein VgrG